MDLINVKVNKTKIDYLWLWAHKLYIDMDIFSKIHLAIFDHLKFKLSFNMRNFTHKFNWYLRFKKY